MPRWVFITVLLCASLGSPLAAQERVLYNGKIFTAEPEHPYAEAVAIRNDKIVAVGDSGRCFKGGGRRGGDDRPQGQFLIARLD